MTETANSKKEVTIQVGQDETTFTTSGNADTTHSLSLTDYVVSLVQKEKENTGIELTSNQEDFDKEYATWFYTNEAWVAASRPTLEVMYANAPAAFFISLQEDYLQKGQKATLLWSEATASNLDFIEYRIVKYNDRTEIEGKEVVSYEEAEQIQVKELGSTELNTSSLAEGCYKIFVRSVDKQGKKGEYSFM